MSHQWAAISALSDCLVFLSLPPSLSLSPSLALRMLSQHDASMQSINIDKSLHNIMSTGRKDINVFGLLSLHIFPSSSPLGHRAVLSSPGLPSSVTVQMHRENLITSQMSLSLSFTQTNMRSQIRPTHHFFRLIVQLSASAFLKWREKQLPAAHPLSLSVMLSAQTQKRWCCNYTNRQKYASAEHKGAHAVSSCSLLIFKNQTSIQISNLKVIKSYLYL